MASPVVGLEGVVPVSSVLSVLRRTTHNGFPVLAPLKPGAQQGCGGGADGGRGGPRGLPGVWGGAGGEPGARQGAGRLQGLVLRSQAREGRIPLIACVESWIGGLLHCTRGG